MSELLNFLPKRFLLSFTYRRLSKILALHRSWRIVRTKKLQSTMNVAEASRQAIELSNSAVVLVDNGNYEVSIKRFSHALKAYKQIMVDTVDDGISISTSLDQCMTQGPKASNSTSDDVFIYRKAIHIPSDIECTYQSSVMVSSMIIFNLAVAHHLFANGNDKARASLLKAAKLYELGFNMQREENFGNNIIFTMATANNMGLIYRHLGDEQTANMCFKHLLSTVMFLVDCGDSQLCELDGFLRNASCVSGTESTSAAAA